MAERDRAAIDVELLGVEAEFLADGDRRLLAPLLDQQQKGAALGRPFVLNRWSILRSFGWFPASICIFEAQDAIQFIFDIGNPLKRYANLLMLAAEEI